MASLQTSTQTNISLRAGLIYQAVGLNQHLKVALGEAGVNVVSESMADRLNLAQLRSDQLDVFVVNLDPELEDHLDDVTDILDQLARPVIFNDGSSSSNLAGWDQARWARHLAAKIRGEVHAHPPRPANAPGIPVPARQVAKAPAPPTPIAAKTVPAAVIASVETRKPEPELPKTIEIPAVSVPVAAAASDVGFAELDFDFDSKPAQPMKTASEFDAGGMDDFDPSMFNFDQAAGSEEKAAEPDLDALFSSQPTTTAAPAMDAGFDLGLDDFETPGFETPSAPTAAPVSASVVESARTPGKAELKAAPSEWSLEPLAGELPPELITGRAVFQAREIPASEQIVPQNQVTVPAVQVDSDLSDFDFFDTPVESASPVSGAPASNVDSGFDDIFKDFEVAAPSAPATPKSAAPNAVAPEAGFDLDFDMDFEVDGAKAAPAPQARAVEDDFSDLDSLFADPPAVPVVKPSGKNLTISELPSGPRHVFVLGASIGGPEAVRTFLGHLKAKLPAAFVLAQHMGAEFLELMTSQLAKASPMPVKLAKPGDKFVEGEIYVVPVSSRFVVNADSVVEFSNLPHESPYSPSIDQVMTDMVDRFGARATSIIFSGMASDAIEGAKYTASRGAKVWVQDPSTCVISSMIDGAQAAGVVSFVGAPEELSERVLRELSSIS